ncbi:Tn3 family transposase [Streptomyces sp. NBC_01594]|uniref:Tn3 family transposase n=1 Tax=Streptomyces sp. NBC_01594 TaxID=2975890 RepID=UPI00386465DE
MADAVLRQEIHQGLQVVENGNSADKGLFCGKHGDLAGADKESQEVSMLALHLLQSSFVHVNTLLMQQVLADPRWGRHAHRRRPAGPVSAVLDTRESVRPVRAGHQFPPRPRRHSGRIARSRTSRVTQASRTGGEGAARAS